MRGETVQLARQAVSEGGRACVLANNRSEGPAPLTVQALAELYPTKSSVGSRSEPVSPDPEGMGMKGWSGISHERN
jgi:hypothetical protein